MGLHNIQHSLVIEVPKRDLSFEVNVVPVSNNSEYITYSLSSSRDKQVSFRHDLFERGYSEGPRLIYSADCIITNGSWMQEHKRGDRIC